MNRDELRAMIDNGKYSPENEDFIRSVRDYLIHRLVLNGSSVIVDETNLDQDKVGELLNWLKSHTLVNRKPIKISIVCPETSLLECINRDKERANSVGADVITKMYEKYIAPGSMPESEVFYIRNGEIER